MKTIMATKNLKYELIGLGSDESPCYTCRAMISGGGILQINNKIYCSECANDFYKFIEAKK